jgi:D-alanine-D-alanine ligase
MKLAILFGGASYEHEISIVSAITMKKVLSAEEPLFIFLDPNHDFYLIPAKKMKTDTFSSRAYKSEKRLKVVDGGFEYKSLFLKEVYSEVRVVNLVHGGDGEDGTLVSLFDFYNIQAISPSREASVISYNKSLTKLYANSIGVKTLPYEILYKDGIRRVEEINYPVILKPLSLGSSIGVSVVEKSEELDYALDEAFQYDDRVIVEPFIDGVKEYNLAGAFTSSLQLSRIEEPKKEKILDFDKKYLDFSRDEVVEEADISKELKRELISNFDKIYLPLFKGSLIRCDFFLIDDEVYLNEINSVPGSLASYLFDGFAELLKSIEIPNNDKIAVKYNYINKIQRAKG